VVICALVELVLLVSKQVAEDQVIWCFVNLELEMWKYSERWIVSAGEDVGIYTAGDGRRPLNIQEDYCETSSSISVEVLFRAPCHRWTSSSAPTSNMLTNGSNCQGIRGIRPKVLQDDGQLRGCAK